MKKIATVFLSVLFCFVFAFGSFAADVNRLSLKAFQPENSNIEVKVNVVNDDSNLYTTEFYIIYDTNSIEYIEGSHCVHEDVKELSPYLTVTEAEKGRIKVSYTSTEGLKKAATLCKMSFKPKSDTLTSLDLEVEHAETFDGDNIRTLDFVSNGTTVHATKIPFWAHINVAAAGVCAVLILGIIVVLFLRFRFKKQNQA